MPLTAQQKHYIKKNHKKILPQQIACDLDLPIDEIQEYLQKHYGKQKYAKIIQKESLQSNNPKSNLDNFSLKKLLLQNKNHILALALLAFFTYFNSLGNSFVSDDIPAISQNPSIGSFTSIFSHGINGILQQSLYFISYKISGLDPSLFRFFNIFFHLGSTILVFLIVTILSKKNIAFIAAALFAVHPLQSEAVIWISAAPYVHYTFFCLLSFLSYILFSYKKNYKWISLASFVVALSASEKAAVFLLILPLYEILFSDLKKNWKRILPYYVIGMGILIFYLSQVGQRMESLENTSYQKNSIANPVYQIPIAIVSYLILIAWPLKLTLYHTEMKFSSFQYFLFLCGFISLLVTAFFSYKKNKRMCFWLAFFVISLLPTLTPFGISWIIAERYVYFGALGIYVIIAMLIDSLAQKSEKVKVGSYAVIILIILLLFGRTFIRNNDWKTEDSLWIATAKVSPSGATIHNNLGDVYARQEKPEKAIEEFNKAIQINPNYADAFHNLANTYIQTGKYEQAENNYKKALQINPRLWQSHQQLSALYYEQKKYDLAKQSIQKALESNPQNEALKMNLEEIEKNIEKTN